MRVMSLLSEWQDRYNKAEASLTSGLMKRLRKSENELTPQKEEARKEQNQRLLQANALRWSGAPMPISCRWEQSGMNGERNKFLDSA